MRSIPAWAGETIAGVIRGALIGVYPRVGGGNQKYPTYTRSDRGLSPRGRGKPSAEYFFSFRLRSIPAWAGETVGYSCPAVGVSVYPRVGGGNTPSIRLRVYRSGLSPRGRGKLADLPALHAKYRSIPAWAGETPALRILSIAFMVYPRVGGGNAGASWCPVQSCWVYPRVGGGNSKLVNAARRCYGLSPRGRGKLIHTPASRTSQRSIPAWAGETELMRAMYTTRGVYPRVGGGNASVCYENVAQSGLSPRGRGKRAGISDGRLQVGSIPAWAGETAFHRHTHC